MSDASTEKPLFNAREGLIHGQQIDGSECLPSITQQASTASAAERAAVKSETRNPKSMKLNQDVKCKATMQSTGNAAPETGKPDADLQDHRISKMEKDVQAQKDANVALESRLKAVTDLFDQERKHRDQLQVRCQELKQNCADMGNSLQNQDIEIQILHSQNLELRHLLAEEKDSKKSMSLKLEDQQTRTQELESRVKSQEISVTKAQEAAVKVLSITVSNAIPDDRIRRQFSDLFRALHNWARENSVEDLSGLRHSSFLLTLVDRKVLADRETWKPEHRFDFDSRTASATLLNASLTKEVCSAFFKNPFAFLQEDETRSAGEPGSVSGFAASTASVLRSVERNLRQYNEASAHAWRAHTVEALSSRKQGGVDIQQYAGRVVDTFLERNAKLLDPEIGDRDRQLLFGIVRDFGLFAVQLWSQKSLLVSSSSKYFSEMLFSVNSDEMEAARAVKLEEHDTGLDGRPIAVVVQPLIMAFGTPEGKDYQKRKIWSKAVVWVSNKNKPTAAAPPSRSMFSKLLPSKHNEPA